MGAISKLARVEGEGTALRLLAYPLLAGACYFVGNIPAVFVALYVAIGVGSAVTAYARTVRLRNGDESPGWMKPAPGRVERRSLPNGLARSPFEALDSGAPLGVRITEAAQTCTLYGRRVIVMSVVFKDLDAQQFDQVAAIVRRVVRQTDLVERAVDNEVIVGLAMVRDYAASDLVIGRLRKALSAVSFLSPSQVSTGAAIYPLHGYSGDDLIAAARSRSQPRSERPSNLPDGESEHSLADLSIHWDAEVSAVSAAE